MPKIAAKGKGKRYPLNMRTTKEVREILEKAARASGRSLVQEVERRLETSFQMDALFHLMAGEDLSRPIMLYLGMLDMQGIKWREVVNEVSEGIALIARAVAADGLPKNVARSYLRNASHQSHPGQTALTVAYSVLEGADLAPDHNELDLGVKK